MRDIVKSTSGRAVISESRVNIYHYRITDTKDEVKDSKQTFCDLKNLSHINLLTCTKAMANATAPMTTRLCSTKSINLSLQSPEYFVP